MLTNTYIKCEKSVEGPKIIKYFQSLGIDTLSYLGTAGGCYYGVDNKGNFRTIWGEENLPIDVNILKLPCTEDTPKERRFRIKTKKEMLKEGLINPLTGIPLGWVKEMQIYFGKLIPSEYNENILKSIRNLDSLNSICDIIPLIDRYSFNIKEVIEITGEPTIYGISGEIIEENLVGRYLKAKKDSIDGMCIRKDEYKRIIKKGFKQTTINLEGDYSTFYPINEDNWELMPVGFTPNLYARIESPGVICTEVLEAKHNLIAQEPYLIFLDHSINTKSKRIINVKNLTKIDRKKRIIFNVN
jgi:hypothetical protein